MGTVLLLQVSRCFAFEPKTTAIIDFEFSVHFPVFDADGQIHMFPYDIAGCIIHFGDSPCTGHYRAALFTELGWRIYEDGQLPDQQLELSEHQRANIILFLLIPSMSAPDRNYGPKRQRMSSPPRSMGAAASSSTRTTGAGATGGL